MSGALRAIGKNRIYKPEEEESKRKRKGLASIGKSKESKEKNAGGFIEGTGYVAGSLGLGLAGVVEGMSDIVQAAGSLAAGDTDMAKYYFLDNKTEQAQQNLTEWYNPGGGMKFVGDVAGGVGQTAGYGLLSAVPIIGTPMMFASIGAQGVSSAAGRTGDVGLKELGYGATVGAVEGILESKLGAGVNAVKSLGSAALKRTGVNVAKSAAKVGGKSMIASVLVDTAKGAAGEFAEEAISEAVDPALLRLFNIDENAQFNLGNVLYAGVVGALSGGLMTAGPAAINFESARKTGQSIREAGEVEQTLHTAEMLIKGAERAQTTAKESKATEKPGKDASVGQKITATAKSAVSGIKSSQEASKARQMADKLQKNVAAYRQIMADPAKATSSVADALLGELRGNMYLAQVAYQIETYEAILANAEPGQKQQIVDVINAEAAKMGAKRSDYTVADLEANTDDIVTKLAAEMSLSSLARVFDTAEATEKPAEPAQAPKGTTAEQVNAQEQNADTEDLSGIEEEVWRAVTDETVKGYGTQNEQEVALLRAAVTHGVPEKSIPLMLERFREGTDMKPAEFADAWADGVLFFGRLGLNEATISQESALSRMSEKARHASVEYGKWLSEEQRAKEQEAAKKKKRPVKEGASKKPKGEVVRHPGINLKEDLDDAQFTAYKAAEIMAPALKADIEIHKGLTRDGKEVNGYYDIGTNTIHININAVRDGKHIALYTLGHEVAHYIKAWSPKKFYELGDYVMDQLGEKAERAVRDKLEFLKRNGLVDGLDETEAYDRAYEEVVADGMELVLTDGTVLKELTRENKTLWQKIKDRIFEIIEKIKKAYGDLSKTSRTAQILSETMDSLDDIEQLFYEGVREAGERTRTAGVETVTRMNEENMHDKRYSFDENFGEQLQDWHDGNGKPNGKYNGRFFRLGTTPEVLVKHGAPSGEVIMFEDCLLKITGLKHTISLEELSKIPSQLNDPILLFKGSVNNSFVALTEIKAKNGHDVVVAVHIDKRMGRSVINKIASVYSKTGKTGENNIDNYVDQQIREGNLLDASPKKAPIWFTAAGLQLPHAVQTIIDAYDSSIAQTDDSVNRKFSISEEIPSTLSAEDQSLLFDADFYERYENESREPITETVEELEAAKASEAFATMSDDEAFDLNAKLKAKKAGYNTVYDYYVETEKERMAEEYRRYVQTGRSNRTSRTLEEKRKKAQKERTLRSDVDSATPLQNAQYQIIQETNPMWDEYHTGIRSPKEIKTFAEVAEDPDSFTWGDFTREDARKALRDGTVRVYSSYAIKNGVFVSTSYKQALQCAGNNPDGVHTRVVALDSVAWINGDEGQYAKVYEDDGIRYSIDDTPETPHVSENETDKLKAENEELTRRVQRLRYDRFRQAAASGEIDARDRRRELSRGVDRVLDSIGVSDGRNRWELFRRMTELYERMAAKDGISYEQAFDEAGEIADWLISAQPSIRDAEASERAGEILKAVTGTRIRLTYTQKADVTAAMGSTEAYRKAMFGRITLSDTDGVPLDQQWAEWSETYPEVFPEDVAEGDMPERLLQICKNLKDMRDRTEPAEIYFDGDALTATIFTEVGQIGWRETKDMPNDYTLLADSLSGAARNVHEYRIIKDFKAMAAELQEAEDRRREMKKKAAKANKQIEDLRRRIKEAEGADTTATEAELADVLTEKQGYLSELDELETKIAKASKDVLSIRAAAPLRRILAEEVKRADAMKRKAEKAEEREAKAKERADKRAERAEEKSKEYRETMDRKADESRERKEMTARKRTIMRVLGGLQTKLVHPTKTNHTPKELHDLVQTVMRTADPKAWDANRKNIREMGDLAAAIEKLERQATRTAKEQERLDAMKSKYEILEQQTMPLAKQAQAMYAAYKQYNDTLPEDVKIPESVMTEMSEMIDKIEDVPLKEMGLESLKAVETFVKTLSYQINNANELFTKKRGEQVSDWGNAASREAAESKPLKWLSPKSMEIKNARDVREFLWKNMKPLTAFEAIGSPKLMELFQSVLDGEEVWITDVLEAREAIVKAKEKYGYDTWDLKTRREFTNGEGKTVKLTVGEMMSLYAYAKREKAMGHLRGGGFVLDAGATEITENNKIRTEKMLNLTERYTMTEEDMGKLAGMLTEEQKQYATEIQDYLTSLGEKGNEISRKLYGLDLFNEKYYFPIKVKSEYLESQTGKTGDPKIKNRGMSKETVPDAQNPLVLQDFMTIVSGHVNDMATYHAFVLPVEDLTRVLNYQPSNAIIDEDGNWTEDKERKEYSTLKAVIESKYGAQANAYIEQLIRDLNGGARREAAANLIDKGITAFKRASTMASLSVLVQQPTSVFRAMAYIDPKHFRSLAALDIKGHKEAWEQVKKYAKVAAIKEMGGYDTGVGTRTADYLNSKDYKTWGERTKAFFLPDVYGGDSNYRAEIFGKGAAYADELAWIQMFDACKREQAEKLGKPMDSEEVLEAAGKRFTEVVRRTQVYDSTLTRSEYMRSKDTGMKMATAFMAEPTTVVSMMLDGLIRANRGDKAFLKKTAGAIAASVIFNALAVSLIYAARDDDEEKTYTEKYLATLATETAEGFNPLEYLPYTRDIMSLMKGYDIERTDMALFADLFKSFERITSSTRTPVEKTTEVAGAVASFFGVPVRNLVRDAMIPVNLVQSATSGERTTGEGISAAIADEFSVITNLFGVDTTNAHELYKAAKSGDQAHYDRVASRYKSEKAAEMALRTALRENDKRIAEAAEAKISGELEAYESIIEQIESEGRFDRNLIIRAINNEVLDIKDNADQVVIPEEEVTDEEDEPTESLYNTSDLNDALTRGDREDFEAVYYYLLATKQEQGKTEAQAKAAVKSGVTSYWKKQYLAAWEENNSAEMKRILELLEETELYGGYNDVATMAQKWIQES